jgi:uncharacterized membrane protein
VEGGRRPEEVVTMTGSSLAPVIIPIFAMFSLAAWLAIIFYADRHPLWGDRTKAAAKSIQSRQIRRFSFASTGVVYGVAARL